MKNKLIDASYQEELALVSQGIDKLMVDIEYRREDIFGILEQYPSIKNERFSDSNFKQTFFDAYKKHFNKLSRHNFSIINKYCKQFPFLTEMTLKDKDAQDKLKALAIDEVEWLGNSSEYSDEECNKYTSDRMSSLFACEDIYNSPFVSNEIKKSNIPGLKKALYRRYQSRHDGQRLKRVHNLAKNSGVSDYDIGQAMYYARSHGAGHGFGWQDACDPKLLEYKEFPKENLKTEEAKKIIRGHLEKHISEGRMESIKLFFATYLFLKAKLEVIAEKIKIGKKDGEKYDKETERIIYFVAEGMKKRLGGLDSKKAQEINTYFADIIAVIPRPKIVEGVYKGMNAMNGHTNDKVKDKQEMLKRFPLTKEEAIEFIKNHSMGYLDELRNRLEYFSDQDFSDMFAEPEVKEKLLTRLIDGTFSYNYNDEKKISFLKNIINVTQEELEDRYIKYFIIKLKKNIKDGNRSRYIKRKLNHLWNLCKDKEKYKNNMNTEEIKSLLLTGAKMRICDHEFSDSFGSDKEIEEICSHEFFPLNPEDIYPKVTEVFLAHCIGGSVPYRGNNYGCIKKQIDEKNPELIEAGIQGLLKLLDVSKYDSDINIDHRFACINNLIHKLPFLYNQKENEKIQDALVILKKHFLSQGRVNKMEKFNNLTIY